MMVTVQAAVDVDRSPRELFRLLMLALGRFRLREAMQDVGEFLVV